ncbi:MAG: hypothetical protein V1875_05120 [Candidatus Altiarchaeota archaeon]
MRDSDAGLKGFWLGMKAAIVASSCCSFPIAFVLFFSALGAGSAAAALKLPRYKWFFVMAGTLFLALSLYLTVRRRSGGACRAEDVRSQMQTIVISVVSYVFLTVLLIYLVLPVISGLAFG